MQSKLIFTITFLSLSFLIQPGIFVNAADTPTVESRANQILKQMGDYLKNADRFSFSSEAYFEQVLKSGQKIQYNSISKVAIQRPNQLRVDSRGDVANDSYYYNGRRITHFDRRNNTHASVKVPATIDAAIDFLAEKYGLTPPLSDLVYKDPYNILTQNVRSGTYIGLSRVRGTMCYHLAFEQDEIDWQVWIDAGWMRVPRKVVITYKKAVGVPQYMAFLTEWDFTPLFPGDLFDFSAPPNAERVEFAPSAE